MHFICSLVRVVTRAYASILPRVSGVPYMLERDFFFLSALIPRGVGFKNLCPENSSHIALALTSELPCARKIKAINTGTILILSLRELAI